MIRTIQLLFSTPVFALDCPLLGFTVVVVPDPGFVVVDPLPVPGLVSVPLPVPGLVSVPLPVPGSSGVVGALGLTPTL